MNYQQRLDHLVHVIQKLSMVRDMETLSALVRHAARELTGADGATFVLRDGDQCHYRDEEAIGPLWKGQRFPMSACVSGRRSSNMRTFSTATLVESASARSR